jgi:xylono-1,5-lactonase
MPPIVRLVWEAGCLLGEGPVWIAREGTLRFVDIKGGKLHCFIPATGARETLEVGGKPSFILPEAGGGFLVGSVHSIYRLDAGRLGERIVVIDQPAHNRTNDGTVDSLGRLWFGTMDDEERAGTGALYCIDADGLHRMGGEAIVTNGPAVSTDGAMLYHVDSAKRTIWRYQIGDGPSLGKGEVFLQLTEADGYPDGVVLDSEGCLWVALWDGWSVRRYSPGGVLLQTVNFPCARVTKIAFGGPDLRTAYVTTARIGLNVAEFDCQPLAGALFAFDAPAAGHPLPLAQLGT